MPNTVDLSEFRKPTVRGALCSVRLARTELPPNRLEAFDAAMAEPDITSAEISRVVNGWGDCRKISEGTVARHRRMACSCA